jgi:hypothetical protein
MKYIVSIVGMFVLVASGFSQSIQSGIIINATATGWSGVHFLPGTYQWEVYAPGKSITGKVHADTNFQVNISPDIDYSSITEFEIVAGNPSETVSVWFNADENPETLKIYDPVGHVVFHETPPAGPKGGFVVVGTFASLRLVKGNTYYAVFTSQIFPLASPTPTPAPTPCP